MYFIDLIKEMAVAALQLISYFCAPPQPDKGDLAVGQRSEVLKCFSNCSFSAASMYANSIMADVVQITDVAGSGSLNISILINEIRINGPMSQFNCSRIK